MNSQAKAEKFVGISLTRLPARQLPRQNKKAQPAKTAPEGGRRRSSAFTAAAFPFPSKGRCRFHYLARRRKSGEYVQKVSNPTDTRRAPCARQLRVSRWRRVRREAFPAGASLCISVPARIDIGGLAGTLLHTFPRRTCVVQNRPWLKKTII